MQSVWITRFISNNSLEKLDHSPNPSKIFPLKFFSLHFFSFYDNLHLIEYFKYVTTLLSYNSHTMELTHVECTIFFPSTFMECTTTIRISWPQKEIPSIPINSHPHCPPILRGFLNLQSSSPFIFTFEVYLNPIISHHSYWSKAHPILLGHSCLSVLCSFTLVPLYFIFPVIFITSHMYFNDVFSFLSPQNVSWKQRFFSVWLVAIKHGVWKIVSPQKGCVNKGMRKCEHKIIPSYTFLSKQQLCGKGCEALRFSSVQHSLFV